MEGSQSHVGSGAGCPENYMKIKETVARERLYLPARISNARQPLRNRSRRSRVSKQSGARGAQKGFRYPVDFVGRVDVRSVRSRYRTLRPTRHTSVCNYLARAVLFHPVKESGCAMRPNLKHMRRSGDDEASDFATLVIAVAESRLPSPSGFLCASCE